VLCVVILAYAWSNCPVAGENFLFVKVIKKRVFSGCFWLMGFFAHIRVLVLRGYCCRVVNVVAGTWMV
jgi:hypothetical protein